MSKKNAPSVLNRIKPGTNAAFNVIFIILSLMCVLPIVLIFIISITDEQSIAQNGYQIIPDMLSASAYSFLWGERAMILQALWISVEVTVVGTAIGVLLTTTMGYVLSRPGYKLNGLFSTIVFIPMIFSGGMVASYVVIAQMLNLRDTIWSLILPLCVSSFNVTICRTYFRTNIPDAVIESAKIDGASQLTIFARIVVPISKPLLATIGLFLAFGYWNDWFQSSLYISDDNLLSLQALLNQLQKNMEFLTKNPTAGMSLQDYRLAMPTESVRMAIAIIIAVPIACVYPFFQKYFISGLTVGAVKG
ncbi:MAG TPA: carbohydrate ABC transporter permease [Candidatus Scatomorpha intestinavium]|uniref:Carbohydrate ABC transporter permease n=1 Tax=Candidatus Scatomorpha intestinavium TaxID=2840922 RepID=A0A9D1CRS6_9FIRM|nr:carbohydrate ABC transporter permease [Candidatus Scatomorpha intestinavium]